MTMPDNVNEEEFELAEKPKKSDGMEDLFKIDSKQLLDSEDLVKVDMEKDILDANEEGNLSDLTDVSTEDVMGNAYGQSPLDGAAAQRKKAIKKRTLAPRPIYYPPTQIGGLNS